MHTFLLVSAVVAGVVEGLLIAGLIYDVHNLNKYVRHLHAVISWLESLPSLQAELGTAKAKERERQPQA